MIILTTLKQKDLAAVSAQQLLTNLPNAPSQINRFDLYKIKGSFNHADLMEAIQDSYIFSNPNKHHLITSQSSLLNKNQIFFHISRKSTLNLTSKVIQLNQKLNQTVVESVLLSELWAFTYPNDALSNISIPDVTNAFIVSSPSNIAPFAHPLIHDVEGFFYDDVYNKLGILSHSSQYDS